VQSIFYKHKSDCDAFQTYKILSDRKFGKQATLSCPNLEHFGSDEFCWEAYEQKLKKIGWAPTRSFNKELINIVEFYKNNFIW